MVKYGKNFRKNQIIEWKEKYFNYKGYKQKIKALINEKKQEQFILKSDNEKENDISKWTFEFEEALDKDIKKIYIFFSNRERTLYQKINKLLHMKENYPNFEAGDYLNQYKDIYDLSTLSLNISNFIYYNLKAIIKILKKYDKKVIGPENKNLQIKITYIQTNLEEQNSYILYLLRFKMIDEINLIIEDLINKLKEQFKLNKNKFKNNTEDDLENKLIEEITEVNQADSFIKQNYDKIKTNIKKIDMISSNVTSLFLPWKDFLRISSDINSKLIQITRENSISMNTSMNYLVRKSIVENINFSKENKYNVIIIFFHGFLYMFSFSVIIPFYNDIFPDIMNKSNNLNIYCGLLMMMVPIGSLFNNFYETFLFKKSTKIPIIISCIGLIMGNLIYFFASYLKLYIFLYIGRFLIGLFNLRTHNKMYLFNYLLKKDISFNLTMFHLFSMIGLSAGFLINTALLYIDIIQDNEIFNIYNTGSFIAAFLSFVLLIFTIILFTEANSKYFNMTSIQILEDGIINDFDTDENIEKNSNTLDIENIENEVKNQKVLLKDIDDKLGDFNKQNNFDDTNLVVKSINELTKKEERSLKSLLNAFVPYLLIIFSTKFINESIYINSFIFFIQQIDQKRYLIPLFLGGSFSLTLLIELSLSCKYICITENNLLIILIILLLINNGLFILFEFLELNFGDFYYFLIIDNILANLIEKYTAHLFMYIIPVNYHLCKIHGNILINIFSMLSRIICCFLLLTVDIIELQIKFYQKLIFLVMTCLTFLSLLFYLIFYQDIRVKAISRIMKKTNKDEIIIATEV